MESGVDNNMRGRKAVYRTKPGAVAIPALCSEPRVPRSGGAQVPRCADQVFKRGVFFALSTSLVPPPAEERGNFGRPNQWADWLGQGYPPTASRKRE